MATIAVFVALGGASYAGVTLSRNSVGAEHIRPGAVRASEVKDRSLGLRELRLAAISALKGDKGDPGAPGAPGAPGPPGADATPADFAGEPGIAVAPAPAGANQCAAVTQFCTGSNNWSWRNFGNGYQTVQFWKDRGGIVHLEGVAELFGGAAGGQPAAFILPAGYRPAAIRRFAIDATADANPNTAQVLRVVEVHPDGRVEPELGGAGVAPLDGISFRP